MQQSRSVSQLPLHATTLLLSLPFVCQPYACRCFESFFCVCPSFLAFDVSNDGMACVSVQECALAKGCVFATMAFMERIVQWNVEQSPPVPGMASAPRVAPSVCVTTTIMATIAACFVSLPLRVRGMGLATPKGSANVPRTTMDQTVPPFALQRRPAPDMVCGLSYHPPKSDLLLMQRVSYCSMPPDFFFCSVHCCLLSPPPRVVFFQWTVRL